MKTLIKNGRIILIIFLNFFIVLSVSGTPNYLKIARQSAEWIRTSAVKKDGGTIWLADPNDKKSEEINLYSGSPGVILFFLELAKSTKNKTYLQDARDGAERVRYRNVSAAPRRD